MKLSMKIRLIAYPILIGTLCFYMFFMQKSIPATLGNTTLRAAQIDEWMAPLADLGKRRLARQVALPSDLATFDGFFVRLDQGKGECLAYIPSPKEYNADTHPEQKILASFKGSALIIDSGETLTHLTEIPFLKDGLPKDWTILAPPILRREIATPEISSSATAPH